MNTLIKDDVRARRNWLAKENRRYGALLAEVPKSEWPSVYLRAPSKPAIRVLRSRDFLVTVYQECEGVERLSICRTSINSDGHFKDGISWDELQRLKNEAGYCLGWAVEVYPPATDVVDVANMRHLWVSSAVADVVEKFAWRKTR